MSTTPALPAAEPDLIPADSIDPATGRYWAVGKPQYWRVAARAHRQYARKYTADPAKSLREAAKCDERAAELEAERVAVQS